MARAKSSSKSSEKCVSTLEMGNEIGKNLPENQQYLDFAKIIFVSVYMFIYLISAVF